MGSSSSSSSLSSSSAKKEGEEGAHSNLATMMQLHPSACHSGFVRDYAMRYGKLTIDEGDISGTTPLMIACRYGNKDVVKCLLALGAEVNTECSQLRNTPLHYTCLRTRDFNGIPNILSSQNCSLEDEVVLADKTAIAKVLLYHGAAYKANSLGLTPICYAGLNQMAEVVNLLGERESQGGTDYGEKIKGLEFLGVSFAINTGPHDGLSAAYSTAYEAMLEAKQLYRGESYPSSTSGIKHDVEDLFKRKECCSVEDLRCLKEDNKAIAIEGFLIGARIIPDELKPHYSNKLLYFARSRADLAEACSIISFLIKATNLSLHKVLVTLRDAMRWSGQSAQTLLELNDVMKLCSNDLSATWCEGDKAIDAIHDMVVNILTTAALQLSCGNGFESFTSTVVGILKHIKEANPHMSTKQEQPSLFSAWVMIESLVHDFNQVTRESNPHITELNNDDATYQVKYAFSQLLCLDEASRTGPMGRTLLHKATENFVNSKHFYADEVFELTLSIITMIIRHGCPVDARDISLYTAKNLAERYIQEPSYDARGNVRNASYVRDEPGMVKLLDVLSGHSSILTLKELAARVIWKWRIPYRDHLPVTMHGTVAGF